jgi:molybdate transport system substrate-binding protein
VTIALVALLAAGCAGTDNTDRPPLLVLASANLQLAFEELVPVFEAASGVDADLVLGSSGNLSTQIRSGAPADIFFAADEAFVDDLIREGFLDEETRAVYAVGRVVIVVPPGRTPPSDLDALADSSYSVLAIANPEYAPYGVAARQALERAGVWSRVEPRVVLGENIAQAFQFVRSGNADAGLVALGAVAGGEGEPIPYTLVDAGLHDPLRQAAAVVAGSQSHDDAEALLDFVLSPRGQEIMVRYGYESPLGP